VGLQYKMVAKILDNEATGSLWSKKSSFFPMIIVEFKNLWRLQIHPHTPYEDFHDGGEKIFAELSQTVAKFECVVLHNPCGKDPEDSSDLILL